MRIYVISGGPGTGKTSTIRELGKKFKILNETAREITQNDERFKGKSVKEINAEDFQRAIFELQKKQIEMLEKLNKKQGIVFSDRGFGDTIAYYKFHKLKVPDDILEHAKNFKYAGIFILDFLKNYKKDKLRQESIEEMRQIHKSIIETYEDLGYFPVIVPFMSVKKRAKFIEKMLPS